MINSPLRAGAVAAAAIGLASALAACASTSSGSSTIGAGGPGTAVSPTTTTAPASPAPSPSPSKIASSGGLSGSPNPGGPMKTPSPTGSPVPQVTKPPTKAIYVPIDKESTSTDGRTIYLEIEARGGACGEYTVVVQESTTDIHVGLAQLPVKPGIMCPMYIGPRTFDAKLVNPVGSRPIIDLANGSRL